MKPLSPIAMMIDKACGFDREAHERSLVTLECSVCHKTQRVRRDKTDPEGTAVVMAPCPECNKGDSLVDYFDASGNQIYPDSPQSRANKKKKGKAK